MRSRSKVAAIILAAGASKRLGRPKQLVPWGDETLLARAIRIAIEAGCAPVVVLGHGAKDITSSYDLSHCTVAVNPEWHQGMGSSIRVGLTAALQMDANAVIVMTCDQPAVSAKHLCRLIEAGEGIRMIASAYAERKGVPAYFPASSFASLQDLRGDSGARELLAQSPTIDLTLGELDVDTEESLRLAKDLLLQSKP